MRCCTMCVGLVCLLYICQKCFVSRETLSLRSVACNDGWRCGFATALAFYGY